jgi:hypothetical protein
MDAYPELLSALLHEVATYVDAACEAARGEARRRVVQGEGVRRKRAQDEWDKLTFGVWAYVKTIDTDL